MKLGDFLKKPFFGATSNPTDQARSEYNTAKNKWPHLSEAELLDISIQSHIHPGSDSVKKLSVPQCGSSWLGIASLFSILRQDEAIAGMVSATMNKSMCELSSDDSVRFLAPYYELLGFVSKETFCSAFLKKNKGMRQTDFWANYREKLSYDMTVLTNLLWRPVMDESIIKRLFNFNADDLLEIAPWVYAEVKDESPSGITYMSENGRVIDLLKIDVILSAEPGLLLVKCSSNFKCYILKRTSEGKAVVVGIHPAAAHMIAYLKHKRFIPLSADTWDLCVQTMPQVGLWSEGGPSPHKDTIWNCAYCGDQNRGSNSDFILKADFDDKVFWGWNYLLECRACKRSSIVLLGYLRRLPDEKNLICYDKSFTLAGGPNIDELRSQLKENRPKGFLL